MKWCAGCHQPTVERMPDSSISPHPGYFCSKCSCLMRGEGMTGIYVGVIVVGIGLLVLMCLALFAAEQPNVA
jgi:hypothetical protein